jgi:hypothetical protein
MPVDLLEQRYLPFVVIGKGNEILAEVFVVHEKYILLNKRTTSGKIRVKRAV